MKTFLKRSFCVLMMLTVVMSMTLGNALTVSAASKSAPRFYGNEYQFMLSPEFKTFGLSVGNLTSKAKVTVSVNKKNIATAKWDKKQNVAWVTCKKTGTVNVTIKVKQNGKTYKHVTKMTWVKYQNPIKSIKIGKTKYNAKYFDKNTTAFMKKVNGKSVVNVQLKQGYKLLSMRLSRGGVNKSIQNGDKITFTKKGKDSTVLFITYLDPKGKQGDLRLFVGDKNYTMINK